MTHQDDDDKPTPRETPSSKSLLEAVRVEEGTSAAFAALITAIDKYESLDAEQRNRLAGFVSRHRCGVLLELLHRALKVS